MRTVVKIYVRVTGTDRSTLFVYGPLLHSTPSPCRRRGGNLV